MVLLMIWIGIAIVTACIASSKGYNAIGWLVLGTFFGVFALIAICFMQPKYPVMQWMGRPPEITSAHPQLPAGPAKRCAACLSMIPAAATACRFCGRDA